MSTMNPLQGMLNGMRLRSKFMMVSILALLPLVVLSMLHLYGLWQLSQQQQREQAAIVMADDLLAIVHEVQLHRYHNVMSQPVDSATLEKTDALWQKAQQDDPYALLNNEALLQQWKLLRNETQLTLADKLRLHHGLIVNLLTTLQVVEQKSGLILDSAAARSSLLHLAYVDLPYIAEDMGRLRALTSSLQVSVPDAQQLGMIQGVYQDLLDRQTILQRDKDWLFEQNPQSRAVLEPVLNAASEGISDALAHANSLISGQSSVATAIGWGPGFTADINAVAEASHRVGHQIVSTMQAAKQQALASLIVWLLMLTLVVLTVLLAQQGLQQGLLSNFERTIVLLQSMAKGDLRPHLSVDTHDEMQEVAGHINRMAESFQNMVRQITELLQRLASSAEELSATSAQTSQGARQQAHQVEDMTTAMSQMNEAVQSMAEHAQVTSAETTEGRNLSESGHRHVVNTVHDIEELAGDLRHTAEIFSDVLQNTEAMGSILAVIRGVADQTNLLALNAAIEAARAGEQGRGFAVVADEVRTLAGRTQSSTTEIDQLIKRLQEGATKAEVAITGSLKRSAQCVESANAAGAALKTVLGAMVVVSDKNIETASAIEEQSRVAVQINQNVHDIGFITRQNTTAFQETAAASAELSRLADTLSSMVARFQA